MLEKIKIYPKQGGCVTISNYLKMNESSEDIGYFNIMNSKGMGFEKFITRESLGKARLAIEEITWLNEDERKDLLEFFDEKFKNI